MTDVFLTIAKFPPSGMSPVEFSYGLSTFP